MGVISLYICAYIYITYIYICITWFVYIAASLDIMQYDSWQLYYTYKQALSLTLAVVCSPPCANGTGVCVANNTCSCAPGYFGDTCSEQGKLHSTQLILQLYMYQLGFMPCTYVQVLVGMYNICTAHWHTNSTDLLRLPALWGQWLSERWDVHSECGLGDMWLPRGVRWEAVPDRWHTQHTHCVHIAWMYVALF